MSTKIDMKKGLHKQVFLFTKKEWSGAHSPLAYAHLPYACSHYHFNYYCNMTYKIIKYSCMLFSIISDKEVTARMQIAIIIISLSIFIDSITRLIAEVKRK